MNQNVVALVDWRWLGHHSNYLVNYAVAMAKTGQRVLPLCPEPTDFSRRFSDEVDADGESSLIAHVEDPLELTQPKPSRIRPARYRGLHNSWRRFGGLGKQLRDWENSSGLKVELVFFACIFDHEFEHFRRFEKRFGFSWSGLYMHARSFRMPGSPMPYTGVMPDPEKLFSSDLLRSVALLDEGAVEPMRKIVGEKPVVWMPDFTNAHLPNHSEDDCNLAKKIVGFAQGRPIICLMGYLVKTKGLEDFTAAIEAEPMRDVFFFLGGEVRWGDIDDQTREKMQRVWERAGNVYAHLQFISSDSEMNAVIQASNVVFAAYRDFPNSSNLLTKAAIFRKPVLVSDGYVMAERVREYGLGEVVPEGDVDRILEALKQMLSDGYYEKLTARARWKDYQSRHSVEQLPRCFEQLLNDSGRRDR